MAEGKPRVELIFGQKVSRRSLHVVMHFAKLSQPEGKGAHATFLASHQKIFFLRNGSEAKGSAKWDGSSSTFELVDFQVYRPKNVP